MPEYNNTWNERTNDETWRENIANIFDGQYGRKVYDSQRLGGMTIDEVVNYITLEHNAIDSILELSDTDMQEGLTGGHMMYYEGTSGKWTNTAQLPLDIHIKSTTASREIKIESTSGTTSTQSIKFKQPDIEWKIEHKRTANNSNGLEISDGSNAWKFETTGALRFNALNSEPANHHKGSMYYNESENTFYVALSNTQTTP